MIVSSSDVGDLLGMCTRVLVLRDGVVATELTGDRLTEPNLLHAMEGSDDMSTDTAAAHASASERHVVTRPRAARRTPPDGGARSSFSNIGAVYVWLLIIVVFSIWVPDTFAHAARRSKQILNNNAVTGLMALSVVIPLARACSTCRSAFTMTLSGVTVATSRSHTGVGGRAGGRARAGRRARSSASSTASSSSAWASTRSSPRWRPDR